MRLVSYGPKWRERAGILDSERIIDLESAMRSSGAGFPSSDMRLFPRHVGPLPMERVRFVRGEEFDLVVPSE